MMRRVRLLGVTVGLQNLVKEVAVVLRDYGRGVRVGTLVAAKANAERSSQCPKLKDVSGHIFFLTPLFYFTCICISFTCS